MTALMLMGVAFRVTGTSRARRLGPNRRTHHDLGIVCNVLPAPAHWLSKAARAGDVESPSFKVAVGLLLVAGALVAHGFGVELIVDDVV
jgi:hypothetical protein